MSRNERPTSPDVAAKEEDLAQYGNGSLSLQELQEKYPNRPRNHSLTLRFSELFISLFNPLNENKPQSSAPGVARSKVGPHGPRKISPQEQRRHIIERFMTRWRSEVGDDMYPALRLILPDKDRDRGVYGLKENTIAKLLVKLMKIDKNSEDGLNLLHWKVPGQTTASRLAGDFAGRCFEVLGRRQMRTEVGDMRIGEVNALLDQLAAASGEAEQIPIFEKFYMRMNAEELMWLIRMILKQMKVGATERTFLDIFHPDGEALFSVSSSLRRVCWELYDFNVRLGEKNTNIALMECFQPQLAQFQMTSSFDKMILKLGVNEEHPEFWIEEKLDGERMQMHMVEDSSVPGGKRFCFWSRKAKDYTYLYGNGFEDNNSALTRHLRKAFDPSVKNIILDGEMITWDPETDKIMPFGTLKTAALSEQKNPVNSSGPRPLYRVFDILLLNGTQLTEYELQARRKALNAAVRDVSRRLEIHTHETATSATAIEPMLRKIVASSSEGLVLKNPRSAYRLNSRNDDWIKVKPEYMAEFGENLDCVIIGGYYGDGRRGGTLSSFMCGLRVSENYVKSGANREKCLSFFKVGGGMNAADYAEIRHLTDGKWNKWDPENPPSEYIELGGGEKRQYERPDVWIRPSESIVIEAKAAEITQSDQFALGWTLRFPRFRRLRNDRSWDNALDIDGFAELQKRVLEGEREHKEMTIESRRKQPARKKQNRGLVIAGAESAPALAEAKAGTAKVKFWDGMKFCVLSPCTDPVEKTKPELEQMIKEYGGQISQQPDKGKNMIIIGDRRVVRVASLIKSGDVDIIKAKWLFDCIAQSEPWMLPFEERHFFFAQDDTRAFARTQCDEYDDSYAREVDREDIAEIFGRMAKLEGINEDFDADLFLNQLDEHGHPLGKMKGLIWRRCRVYFAPAPGLSKFKVERFRNYVEFGRGTVATDIKDPSITHVVIVAEDEISERETGAEVRHEISSRRPIPRIVTTKWVEDSWNESTLLDEEYYAPK